MEGDTEERLGLSERTVERFCVFWCVCVCCGSTILTMIGVCQDSQVWREGGGNMEEGL